MAISRRSKKILLENYHQIFDLITQNKVHAAKVMLETELRQLREAGKTIDEKLGDELIALILLARSKEKDDVRLYVQEAMVYELQGKKDFALGKYEMIRAKFPTNNHHASLYAARILIDQGRYFKSEAFLRDVLRQQLRRAKPIAQKHIKSAENMLAEIKDKHKSNQNVFSKEKPMHVFFAELAAKARLKPEQDSSQQNNTKNSLRK